MDSSALPNVEAANNYVAAAVSNQGSTIQEALDGLKTEMFDSDNSNRDTSGSTLPLFPFGDPSLQMNTSPTTTSHPPGTRLVRGLAMVQDMEDSVGFYEGPSDNFFWLPNSSTSSSSSSESKNLAVDALQLYLVPIPGWNYWIDPSPVVEGPSLNVAPTNPVSSAQDEEEGGASRKRTTRDLEEEEDEWELEVVDEEGDAIPEERPAVDATRQQLSSGCTENVAPPPKTQRLDPLAAQHDKKPTTSTSAAADSMRAPVNSSKSAALTLQLNLPADAVHEKLQVACVATVLLPHGQASSSATSHTQYVPKLNDIVEVVGFITDDLDDKNSKPQNGGAEHDGFSAFGGGAGMEFMMQGGGSELDEFAQWRCTGLPTSIVRTVMTIAVRPAIQAGVGRVSLTSASIPRPLTPPTSSSLLAERRRNLRTSIGSQRGTVLDWLTTAVCQGDPLVAEFLLAQLCSKVLHRVNGTPIGDLPLHLIVPPVKNDESSSSSISNEVGSNGGGHYWNTGRSNNNNGVVASSANASSASFQNLVLNSSEQWREEVRRFTKQLRQVHVTGGTVCLVDQDRHRPLIPSKNPVENSNFLKTGLLQLPKGSHLTVDLTTVQQGHVLSWQEQADGKAIDRVLRERENEKNKNGGGGAGSNSARSNINNYQSEEGEAPANTTSSVATVFDNLVHKQQFQYKYLYSKVELETDIATVFISGIDQMVLSDLICEMKELISSGKSTAAEELRRLAVSKPCNLLKREDYVAELHFTIPWLRAAGSAPRNLNSSSSHQQQHSYSTGRDGSAESAARGGGSNNRNSSSDSTSQRGFRFATSEAANPTSRGLASTTASSVQVQRYLTAVQELLALPDEDDEAAGSAASLASAHEHQKILADLLLQEKTSFPERFNSSALIHNNTMSMRMSLVKAMAVSYGLNPHDHGALLSTLSESSSSVWDLCQVLEKERVERCRSVVSERLQL